MQKRRKQFILITFTILLKTKLVEKLSRWSCYLLKHKYFHAFFYQVQIYQSCHPLFFGSHDVLYILAFSPISLPLTCTLKIIHFLFDFGMRHHIYAYICCEYLLLSLREWKMGKYLLSFLFIRRKIKKFVVRRWTSKQQRPWQYTQYSHPCFPF